MIDTIHYAIVKCLRIALIYSTETFCSHFDRPDLRYEPGFHKYSSIEALQKYAGRQIEDSEVFNYGGHYYDSKMGHEYSALN
jgi:hypothetical protein